MDAIIQTLLACVGSSGLTAIILALLQRRWSKADKRDAVVAGLKVLTVDRCAIWENATLRTGKSPWRIRRTCKTCTGHTRTWAGTGTWRPLWLR